MAAGAVQRSSPRLSLEEQLRLLEEWMAQMFFRCCSPLED